ncbi:MAG: hypothetical protein WCP61_08920 [Chitinophagia bacterium]
MNKLFLVIVLLTSTKCYSQQTQAEHKAVVTYFKNAECIETSLTKDSIILFQSIHINACDKFADSLKFELNTAIVLGQNLSKNCKSEIAKIKKGQAIKSAALYVLIPIFICEIAIILIR